ncbi:ABC1 family-domain-containing protein [Cladochytrium replicatum]|nr:ABC1 family-domain-containing protein [Cladochytrium replicatum]
MIGWTWSSLLGIKVGRVTGVLPGALWQQQRVGEHLWTSLRTASPTACWRTRSHLTVRQFQPKAQRILPETKQHNIHQNVLFRRYSPRQHAWHSNIRLHSYSSASKRRFPLHLVVIAGGVGAFAIVGGGIFLWIASQVAVAPLPQVEDEPKQERQPKDDKWSKQSPSSIFFLPLILIRNYIFIPIRIFARFTYLAVLFAPVIVLFPVWLASIWGTITAEKSSDAETRNLNLWWIQALVAACELAGPAFIKLGQYASSRTDLFQPEVCAILAKLQSRVNPHPFYMTKRILMAEFGRSLDEIFESFDETPIGVGAIAQVYKARLKSEILESYMPSLEDGVDLSSPRPCDVCAVKVLHPYVAMRVEYDLAIIRGVASVIHYLIPGARWLSLPQEVDVFGEMMREQVDLRTEARNLLKFGERFGQRVDRVDEGELGRVNGGGRRRCLSFPVPYKGLVGRTVLVETFLDAIPVTKFLDLGPSKVDTELAEIGLDSLLRMLIIDNFVHADLHPGNIFVTFQQPPKLNPLYQRVSAWAREILSPTPSPQPITWPPPLTPSNILDPAAISTLQNIQTQQEWSAAIDHLASQGYRPRLIFLDAGLVCTLSHTNLRNFLDLFLAIAEFDGKRAGKLMVERSKSPETVLDLEGFAGRIEKLIRRVQATTLALSNIKLGDILGEVFFAVRRHRVKLEGDFVNVGISVMLLEGIGRRLNPDLDLLEQSLPVLRAAALHGFGREVDVVVEKGVELIPAPPMIPTPPSATNVIKVIEGGESPSAAREMERLAVWVFWKAWAWERLAKVLRLVERNVDIQLYEEARETIFPDP